MSDRGLYLFITEGGQMMARVPALGNARESTFRIPAGEAGMSILRHVLQERRKAESESSLTVGNAASPVEAMIEAWQRAGGVIKRIETPKRGFQPKPDAEKMATQINKLLPAEKAAILAALMADVQLEEKDEEHIA